MGEFHLNGIGFKLNVEANGDRQFL